VAQALLTGYRADMEREVSEQYAGTGVAHIIAISGLHLGMIQASLMLILLPLTRWRWGQRVRAALVIPALWAFAFFTGATPSVLRAAFMFSLLLFGTVIGRKGNPYNSLAASAFILLLFQPALLFHAGFQLSYSAVLSIFVFGGPIGQWVQSRHRWINQGWRLMSVTLAAQVFTLPFVIYYFHQFPLYFLLSNLVAVSLSWIVLNLLMLLGFVFGWWPAVASLLGQAIHGLLHFLNRFIQWVYHLPLSRIEEIYLPLPQAFLLAGVVALVSAWLLLRHKNSLVWAIAGVLAFILLREWNWVQSARQRLLVVYNIRQHTAVEMIRGHHASFFGDTACIRDPNLYRTHIVPAHRVYQIKHLQMMERDTAGFTLLQVGGRRILVLDREPDVASSGVVKADMLLIATNLRVHPRRVLEKVDCPLIVATAQLPAFRVRQWQIAADSLPLRFHPVAEKGAFIWDLSKP
jgi:competence protein ComEC